MDENHLVPKDRGKVGGHLVGKGNFRNQDQGRSPLFQGVPGGLEVDLRLSAARDALQEKSFIPVPVYGTIDGFHRALLFFRELASVSCSLVLDEGEGFLSPVYDMAIVIETETFD